jgi:hypothetical protein
MRMSPDTAKIPIIVCTAAVTEGPGAGGLADPPRLGRTGVCVELRACGATRPRAVTRWEGAFAGLTLPRVGTF